MLENRLHKDIDDLEIFKYMSHDNELSGLKYYVLSNGDIDCTVARYVDMFNESKSRLISYRNNIIHTPMGLTSQYRSYEESSFIKKADDLTSMINYHRDFIVNLVKHHIYYITKIVFEDFTYKLHNGKIHSLESPAVTKTPTSEIPFDDMYYINDVFYEYPDWVVEARKYKIKNLIKKFNI